MEAPGVSLNDSCVKSKKNIPVQIAGNYNSSTMEPLKKRLNSVALVRKRTIPTDHATPFTSKGWPVMAAVPKVPPH
jgi:hypothetical protein